nr:MAG TPA: hypothetical protein [Caudoviricetes sp.]
MHPCEGHPVSGRAAGVRQNRPGDPAPAPGGRGGHHHPGVRVPDPAQPVHAGVRHEPLPLRVVRASLRPLHLFGKPGGKLYAPHFRPPAGPH